MSDQLLIEAKQISRYYGPQKAVENLSFTLKPGEILGFLGPNGAGKSTTMKMLTGNLAASSGEIFIDNQNIEEHPLAAKKALGYLPETPPIYHDLTVIEQLRFAAELHKLNKADKKTRIEYVINACQLESVKNRLVGQLSKGFKQRVGLAQALIHDPKVLVLDEPTSGLDPTQIVTIRQLIKELAKERGILLSTHILQEVQSLCDHVMIINQGHCVYEGSVNQLNHENQQQQTLLRFCSPVAPQSLPQTGIEQCEVMPNNAILISHTVDWKADTLTRWSVEQNNPLVEITPQAPSLEQLFIRLTCDDPAQRGNA